MLFGVFALAFMVLFCIFVLIKGLQSMKAPHQRETLPQKTLLYCLKRVRSQAFTCVTYGHQYVTAVVLIFIFVYLFLDTNGCTYRL